jgi:hypothetical protein
MGCSSNDWNWPNRRISSICVMSARRFVDPKRTKTPACGPRCLRPWGEAARNLDRPGRFLALRNKRCVRRSNAGGRVSSSPRISVQNPLQSTNRAKLSVQFLYFSAKWCRIAANVRHFAGHFVHVSFVFIHILALNVILFIFPARPAPDSDFLLVLGVADSPQGAEVEVFHVRHEQPSCHQAWTRPPTIPTILAIVKENVRLGGRGSHISRVPRTGSPQQ